MAKVSTKRQAQNKASELFRKYPKVPFPIERVAANLGVTIIHHELEPNVSGFLIVKHRKPIIVVNKTHSEVRQRFTIAHELGHYQLHFDNTDELFHRDENSSQGNNRLEVQANNFAAALLIPEDALKKELGSQIIDTFDDTVSEKIIKLANKFGVSQQAMSIRLQELGYMF